MEQKISCMEELVQTANSNPVRYQSIPRETAQSYPVPVQSEKGISVAFMYYMKKVAPPADPILSSPRFLMLVNPSDGEILQIKRVKPSNFGIDWPEEKPVGIYKLAPEITVEIFFKKRKQLFALYDKILPLYENSNTAINSEERKTLAEFYELFNELVEKPLLPYYKALNPDFFPWIEGLVNSQCGK